MPSLGKNKWLSLFLEMVQADLNRVDWTERGPDNLSHEERRAIRKLNEVKPIVVIQSDKGGNVVLLDEILYEKEATRLLGDQKMYEKLDFDPFLKLTVELNEKFKMDREEGLLSRQEFEYLRVRDFNVPLFYIIPKVHKSLENPPGRPIVSAVKGPLEKTGTYLDSLLKEMVTNLKSYVQDTKDILAHISGLKIDDEIWLVG